MTDTAFTVVIPARYESQRLPGKPLADIAGAPMVVRVAERAARSQAADTIVVTDDERVAAAVRAHGGRAEMTSSEHASGTDRIAELAGRAGWDGEHIVVNVQGDEPLIPPELIDQVALLLARHKDAAVATLTTPFTSDAEYADVSTAKVVADRDGYALYFSRAGIPFPRDGGFPDTARRHIGIYAYRVAQLLEIAAEPPCELELAERLEQLRVLWMGKRIVVADAVTAHPPGVDTPEDLDRVCRQYAGA